MIWWNLGEEADQHGPDEPRHEFEAARLLDDLEQPEEQRHVADQADGELDGHLGHVEGRFAHLGRGAVQCGKAEGRGDDDEEDGVHGSSADSGSRTCEAGRAAPIAPSPLQPLVYEPAFRRPTG